MFKKILPALLALTICAGAGSAANAQDFNFVYNNPVHDTTSGVMQYDPQVQGPHAFVEVRQFIKNITASPYRVAWRYLFPDTTVGPSNVDSLTNDWFITGICDNLNCRGMFLSWYYGATDTSGIVQPNQTMLIETRIYAPSTSRDTTEIFRVQLKSPNQTDTAVYIVTKIHGLGIHTIQVNDNRVAIYPNPLPEGQDLNLYINKDLKAEKAEMYNIIGQRQNVFPLARGKEIQSLDISNLPAGIYILKLTNESGKIITSRKFVKQ